TSAGPLFRNNHNDALPARLRHRILLAAVFVPYGREARVACELGLREDVSITVALKYEFRILTCAYAAGRRLDHRAEVTIEAAYLQDLPIRTRVKHSDRVLARRQRGFADIECE